MNFDQLRFRPEALVDFVLPALLYFFILCFNSNTKMSCLWCIVT